MLTLQECIGWCALSEEEILAIAEHQHIPEIAAVEMANYLITAERGPERICTMIVDDIRASQRLGDVASVIARLHVLHHYLRRYPEACPKIHPWSSVM